MEANTRSRYVCRLGAVVTVWLACFSLTQRSSAEPTIDLTSLPTYGQDGEIEGTVSGVTFADYRVAAYIQIEGAGWWTKPTFETPTVSIASDGTFSADVAVPGTLDNRATIFCVALIAATDTPPQASGTPRIPAGLTSAAMDCEERYAREISFAGRTWAVKEAPGPVDPGSNRYSLEPDDVFVDTQGLHLSIKLREGHWRSSEVILRDRLGFGTYAFMTASRLDILDSNVVLGAFIWDPYGDEETVPNSPSREVDFEDTRWANPADPFNAQFVVQHWDVPGNLVRYTIPDLTLDSRLTRFFTWAPDRIKFVALRGFHDPHLYPPGDRIHQYTYLHDPGSNHFVPTEGRESFRFNLYLLPEDMAVGGVKAPSDGLPVEVIITDFSFTAAPPPLPSLAPWKIVLAAALITMTGSRALRSRRSLIARLRASC